MPAVRIELNDFSIVVLRVKGQDLRVEWYKHDLDMPFATITTIFHGINSIFAEKLIKTIENSVESGQTPAKLTAILNEIKSRITTATL